MLAARGLAHALHHRLAPLAGLRNIAAFPRCAGSTSARRPTRLTRLALVLVLGGGREGTLYDEYWGARLWYNPGAFANGFKGVCAVFVTAAFSFSGTELVGLAAAESANPAKSLPGAIKQVFWRITLFYILSLMFVGLLVPYDEERLIGGGG